MDRALSDLEILRSLLEKNSFNDVIPTCDLLIELLKKEDAKIDKVTTSLFTDESRGKRSGSRNTARISVVSVEGEKEPKYTPQKGATRKTTKGTSPRSPPIETRILRNKTINQTVASKSKRVRPSECNKKSTLTVPEEKAAKIRKTREKSADSPYKTNKIDDNVNLSNRVKHAKEGEGQKSPVKRSLMNDKSLEREESPSKSSASGRRSVAKKLVKDSALKRNVKGETALHSACTMGKLDLVEKYLSAKANPNTKDNAGWTPLHEAVSANSYIVKLLLEHGAVPDVPGPDFMTPLHEAVRIKNKEIITLLVQYGANINSRNVKGSTPLDLAVDDDDIKTVLTESVRNPMPQPQIWFTTVINDAFREDLKIYPFMLSAALQKKLNELKQHHNFTIVNSIDKTPTHMVTSRMDVNITTLTAVALGIPIVRQDWIEESSYAQLMDLRDFMFKSLGHSNECVKLAFINRIILYPNLFSGCYFFFRNFDREFNIGSSSKVTQETLSKLVLNAGGKILKREPNPEGILENERGVPFHAAKDSDLAYCSHFIIFQNKPPPIKYNMKHMKTLHVNWVIECIQQFRLINPQSKHVDP